MKICPSCSFENTDQSMFCVKCGTKLLVDTVLICVCGAPWKEGAKFCVKCGKKAEEILAIKHEEPKSPEISLYCKCGRNNPSGAKFCVNCGKPVQKQHDLEIIPEIKSVTSATSPIVNQPKLKENKTSAKPVRKRKGLKVAAVIFLLISVGVGGYYAYDYFLGGINKKLLLEQSVKPSEKDQTIAYENEVSVTIPMGLIEKEQTLKISSVKGLPEIEEGVSAMTGYEVKLGDVEKFDTYIEITMNYDPAKIPQGMKADEALTCQYYNESAKKWEPVPFILNESKHQITVYTNHLSIFAPGVAGEKVPVGPMMKVKTVRFPAGEMMSEEEVTKVLSRYSSSPMSSGNREGLIEGYNFVNEWFGVTSNVSTFTENAMEVGALEGVNKIATEVGLGFALVQAGIDFSEGKDKKAVLDLTKNLSNYAIGKIFNTAAINIAFVGVFAIDYSLNKFATEAISGRNDIYQKAYNMYYSDKVKAEKINSVWWYKKLKKVARETQSTTDAEGNVNKFLHDYAYEFWNNPEVVAQYLEKTGLYSTGFGGLNEDLKKEISENQLKSIVRTLYGSSVFDRIMKELRLEAMSKLYDRLCYIKDQYNIEYPIKVIVKKDPESEDFKDADISSLPVRFVVNNPVHKDLWKGSTDKNGEMDFRCTALGYVDAGCPTSVEVEVPSAVDGGKSEVFSGDMKLGSSGKTTVVEIIIGSPKLEGTWKLDATITFMKLDASLQYMDAMADFYGSGDEYRKERANVTEGMKGQKAKLPDLVMDGMENIWKVTKEGGFIVITSPGFEDKKGLGGSQYRIKFNGRKQFTGTMESRGYLGTKENVTKFDIVGTRIK